MLIKLVLIRSSNNSFTYALFTFFTVAIILYVIALCSYDRKINYTHKNDSAFVFIFFLHSVY